MRLNQPRDPSRRNFSIYYAHVARGGSQREVALLYNISQGRVSQIVKQVRKWVGCVQPHRNTGMNEAEETYAAVDAHLHRLRWYETNARHGFELTCEHPSGKPARPDVRFLKKGEESAEKLHQMELTEIQARAAARQAPSCQTRLEDAQVATVLRECRRAQRQAEAIQKKLGVQIEVPAYDAAEIERHVRNACRRKSQRCLALAALYPKAWEDVVKNVYDRPFDVLNVDSEIPTEDLIKNVTLGSSTTEFASLDDVATSMPEPTSEIVFERNRIDQPHSPNPNQHSDSYPVGTESKSSFLLRSKPRAGPCNNHV